MDTHALIGKVITRSHAIEKLLQKHYPTGKKGLFAVVNGVTDTFPSILARSIKAIAVIRNFAAHPDGFRADDVPPDFDRLCDEIELLIPYFANRERAAKTLPAKEPNPPVRKPQTIVASAGPATVANNVPANHGKQWMPEEDQRLADGFDARVSIPDLAKAHQRGVGGIQKRLVKLGKMTAEEFKTYPPDSPSLQS